MRQMQGIQQMYYQNIILQYVQEKTISYYHLHVVYNDHFKICDKNSKDLTLSSSKKGIQKFSL
jgi:hypothetical protein